MNKKFICFLGLCLISLNIFCAPVQATSGNHFSVRAVIPENQVDKDQTYFDLRMEAGDKQTVQMMIDNSESEEIIASVALNAAATGQNGLMVYNQPEARDESLTVSITDIASVTKSEIRIPANSSATVDIEIQMPDQTFDGVILGGLVTTARKAVEDEAVATAGTTVNNEFAYVIGLQITENDREVKPDFEFVSVSPELINYHNAVTLHIRNKVPRIIKGAEVEAAIYKKNSTNIYRDLKLTNVEMAPNSTGEFVVDWDNNIIESGTYRLDMTLRYQGQEWTWEEEFAISPDEATAVNKSAVNLPSRPGWIYIVAAIVLVSVAAVAWVSIRQGIKNKRK